MTRELCQSLGGDLDTKPKIESARASRAFVLTTLLAFSGCTGDSQESDWGNEGAGGSSGSSTQKVCQPGVERGCYPNPYLLQTPQSQCNWGIETCDKNGQWGICEDADWNKPASSNFAHVNCMCPPEGCEESSDPEVKVVCDGPQEPCVGIGTQCVEVAPSSKIVLPNKSIISKQFGCVTEY